MLHYGCHVARCDPCRAGPIFQATKNFVSAGTAVKAAETMRKHTLDYGTIGDLHNSLIVLA